MTSKVIKVSKGQKTVRFIMYSHRYYKLIRKRGWGKREGGEGKIERGE